MNTKRRFEGEIANCAARVKRGSDESQEAIDKSVCATQSTFPRKGEMWPLRRLGAMVSIRLRWN